MKIQALLSASLLALCGAVLAQTGVPGPAATPRVDQRQANQEKRIDQGIASGALNKREAARLQARQNKLAADEAAAKADGVVTRKERVRLNHEADRSNRAIVRQKHDRQNAKVTP